MDFFGLAFGGGRGGGYQQDFVVFSMMMLPGPSREVADKGGKIIMPPSALERLSQLQIEYPMMFSVVGKGGAARQTHCGVLEFVADEGVIHMPRWMMSNLFLSEGDRVTVRNVSIPVAQYAKFQPQSVDFLDISNPKAVLENGLRSFSCLTEGDVIAIPYNKKVYEICVREVRPKQASKAVSIVECDMQLDFDAPIGYVEPAQPVRVPLPLASATAAAASPAGLGNSPAQKVQAQQLSFSETHGFLSFSGNGARLDGKTPLRESPLTASMPALSEATKREAARKARAQAAEARFTPGKLSFSRAPTAAVGVGADQAPTADACGAPGPKETTGFKPFEGSGNKLR